MAHTFPKNLIAGFNKRGTTRLAFISYMDEKNLLRFHKSWMSWKDSKIPDQTFINEPLTGFVINKNVMRNGHFGGGKEYIRVWHPLGFEFEISTAVFERLINFVDISKGEVLTPCVLGWEGQKVELISTLDPLFKEFTENAVYGSDNFDLPVQNFEFNTVYDFKGQHVVYCGFGGVKTDDLPYYLSAICDDKYPYFMDLLTFTLFQPKTRIKYMRKTAHTLNNEQREQYERSASQNFLYDLSHKNNSFRHFGLATNKAFFNPKKLWDDVRAHYLCMLPLSVLNESQKNEVFVVANKDYNDFYSVQFVNYNLIVHFNEQWYKVNYNGEIKIFDIHTIDPTWHVIRQKVL